MAPLRLPARQLNCDETLLLADCAGLHQHNLQSAHLFDGWIQKYQALDGMGIDTAVTRRTIVLATDASNQDGEDRGILAGKPMPLDVAGNMLHIAEQLKTEYDSVVIAGLRLGEGAENLVWLFQPPTSDSLKCHANSWKEPYFYRPPSLQSVPLNQS